jgi:hypothetical protein
MPSSLACVAHLNSSAQAMTLVYGRSGRHEA